MYRRPVRRTACLFLLSYLCVGPPVSSQDPPAGSEITPPQVFQAVSEFSAELELVRRKLAKPRESRPEINVRDVAPREVYFQAQSLAIATDALCFEQIRRHLVLPELPTGTIRPADVIQNIHASLEAIRSVKRELGITAEVRVPPIDPAKTPTDVFRATVQAKRQLNRLREKAFRAEDVYMRVTEGIAYAARLMKISGHDIRIPEPPAFEDGYTPSDVFGRLLACIEIVERISQQQGLTMLSIDVESPTNDTIEPSDVFDLASLLLSELAYFHQIAGDNDDVLAAYHPGHKTPSHVFQRVGILERQLNALLEHGRSNPRWIHGVGNIE